ncbi:hypothetical protein ENUP19_0317G0084 [Entamoeba nuttalli]|uniref:Uncharacterized protein n=1 Tax=Entamoeba nuttalli TaxID=412467 RepID=A0ABQ0DW45_9EUKA
MEREEKYEKPHKKQVRSVDDVKIYSVNHPIEQKAVKEKHFVEIDDTKSKNDMRKEYKSQKHQKPKGKTPQRGGKRIERFEED